MPLARAVPRAILALLGWVVSGCANAPARAPEPDAGEVRATTAHMPREIRMGAVEMAIQAVEPDVSRAEIASALAPMLANAPVCMRWPALWMEQTRRTSFVVRYDLMARDWGEDSAAGAEARMADFVNLGFVTASAGGDPRVVTYTLTEAGVGYLNGIIEAGQRPRFCAPAERRLVEITNVEWGRFPCGTLRVQFTHIADGWPSWARSEATRARLAANWAAVGVPAQGSVSLSRVWYSRAHVPAGFTNGALVSACYDSSRGEVVATDLNLDAREID